jgi:hypothetical protein
MFAYQSRVARVLEFRNWTAGVASGEKVGKLRFRRPAGRYLPGFSAKSRKLRPLSGILALICGEFSGGGTVWRSEMDSNFCYGFFSVNKLR